MRVQILVAAIDAIGIGVGAAILGVRWLSRWGVGLPRLLRSGDWCPHFRCCGCAAGAGCSGPVQALIMLGIVLLVQQLESHSAAAHYG